MTQGDPPRILIAEDDDSLRRLLELRAMQESGDVSVAEGAVLARILSDTEADPNALVMTPGVLQIVARKPA